MLIETVTMRRISLLFRKNATFNSLLYTRLLSMSNQNDVITIEEVRKLKDNLEILLVDVREPNEIANTGFIPGSINIPLNSLEDELKGTEIEEFQRKYQRAKPKLETPIVFTCRSGRRAGVALEIARKLGYQNVMNYKGSWLEWEKYLPK